jgi:hypothetical protein
MVWPKVADIILQNRMAFFITLILVLFAGFREIGFDRDSKNYAIIIQSINSLSFSDLNFFEKEPSFYLFAYVANWLFSDAVRGTFVIYALFGIALKIIGIYRLSRIPLLSVIFYISSYYILHELTQIRVGVASAIFLLAIPDIVNKDSKAYMIKTIFAIFFHYSAIIMLPLYLIVKMNKWFYYIIPIFGLFIYMEKNAVLDFIIANTFLLNYIPSFLSYKPIYYLDLVQRGITGLSTEINIFDIYHCSLLIIYYFCIINYNRFKSMRDIVLIKILGLSLFTFYFFSFVPVLAVRISEFLGIVIIILLISIVHIFKQKKLIILLILFYSLIRLYSLLFITKLLHI